MRYAALLFGLVAACSAEPRRYHVADGAIRDPDGATIILRGVNVSGRHKTTPYFDYHEQADYAQAAGWGFNAVRFLVSWAALEPMPGVYDEAYVAGVRARVQQAGSAGLRVIVDMHQDVFGIGFAGGNGAPRWACDEARYAGFVPTSPWFLNYLDPNVQACFDQLWTDPERAAQLAGAWAHLAEALVDLDFVIGFDPINEPHWGSYDLYTFERDRLQTFHETIIAAVRAVAPDWLAFVEPASSRNVGVPTGLMRFAAGRVVYAPHSYDTMAESGLGFGAERRAALLANVAAMRDEATKLDAALWIGEYGGIAAHANIGDYMDAQYDAIGAVAGSSMYWHFSRDDGYGLLDPKGNEKPALLAAVMRPYPERVVGDLVSYAWDDSSITLTIVTRGARAVDVRWPARLGTPTAACAGCTSTPTATGLRVTGALPAMLTLH